MLAETLCINYLRQGDYISTGFISLYECMAHFNQHY